MIKSRKITSLGLAATLILASLPISSFADVNNHSEKLQTLTITESNTDKISTRGVNTPAFYEHKYNTEWLTTEQLDQVVAKARKYQSSGTTYDLLGFFSLVTGLVPGLQLASFSSGVGSYMKSDIDVTGIIVVAYDQQRLMRETGWTKRETGFHSKRFFNGNVMGEWYLSNIYDATNF